MRVHRLPLVALALLSAAELVKKRIALNSLAECFFALAGQFVVFAGRALVSKRAFSSLPVGLEELLVLETTKSGVNGTARKGGNFHNVEPVFVSGTDGLEKKGRRVG